MIYYYTSLIQKAPFLVLDLFKEFSDLSGYKINWDKSALIQLNEYTASNTLTVDIPVKSNFTYLGINVQVDIRAMTQNNYEKLFKNIEKDLERWKVLPASLLSCIATLKINVLPRINFLCSMIPLPPPAGYWFKVDALIRKYLWWVTQKLN